MDRNQVAVQIMMLMVMLSVSLVGATQMYMHHFMQMRRKRRQLAMEQHLNDLNIFPRRRSRLKVARLVSLIPNPRPVRDRMQTSSDWWDNTVPNFSDRQWLNNFRIRKGTFNWICKELRSNLKPRPNPVPRRKPPLSVEKIVAIALYKLAHTAEYIVVANQFGVCKSTVHNCLYAFCRAIIEVLHDRFLQFPDEEEAKVIADSFKRKTNIPQLIGAIDGSHIPITPPLEGNSDFINRKLYPSMILQGIVDHQYCFRNISCILPGSCHDIDALKESDFYKNREKYMPKGHISFDGIDIPYMLMGDPAYPLTDWLLKNYSYDANMTRFMDSFNVYMNKGRVVVENAFGRLKSRWRILARQSDVYYKFVPTVVAACCILHNICEASKETFYGTWLSALREDERDYPQPDTVANNLENQYDAVDIRDHLMLYLARNCDILTSSRGRCVGV